MSTPAWAGVEYKGYAFTDNELESVIPQLGDNILNAKKQYWQEKLQNVRDYISKALDAVFASAEDWQRIMQERAVPRYRQFVNPAYARADLIQLKYAVKLAAAYDKWKQRKDEAFQEGGAFDKGVQSGADYYAQAVRIVYRLTGVRPLGIGPAVKVFMVASGMKPPIIEGRDTLTGEPRNLFFTETLYFVGYAMIPAIVTAATYAHYAHLAGDYTLRDQILADISSETQEILSRLAADDVQIDSFQVAYDGDVDNYYVYLKASPKSG